MSTHMELILLIIGISLLTYLCIRSNKKNYYCEKDKTKVCPFIVRVSRRGTAVYGMTECCKFKERTNKFLETISKLEPGKDYNGYKFSKEVLEKAKQITKKHP